MSAVLFHFTANTGPQPGIIFAKGLSGALKYATGEIAMAASRALTRPRNCPA